MLFTRGSMHIYTVSAVFQYGEMDYYRNYWVSAVFGYANINI